ncbi:MULTISPECIES: hypothetical protein [Proteiniphilum]|jgi:hypothetical protein|uniref:hypothetical protein n=1 Tax=Proteiniphilum TaxID=294702 RepID=UPI000E7E4B83|nr:MULTISPECIES: hypothetical protein [Proteiniphilum]ULB34259.1 hypothetical protein KDN43_15040 [Proteiniphilum propionicum]HAC74274.1 hypothetical protein [Porphyromonadaceae bacterium]HBF95575.1 hypothetical protein [Porphyromonadaceae bacterium]
MEEIRFDSPFNKEVFIRSNRIFWQYTWNNRKKQLIRWLGMAVIFLGLGIAVGERDEMQNPYIFIAIFCFSLMILSATELFFSWKKHNKKMQEIADEYEKADSEYIIELSEELVKLSDFQACITLKWSAFKYYTIYKEHIILIPNNYISGGLLFDKNGDEPKKYNQTLELLEHRLKYIAP